MKRKNYGFISAAAAGVFALSCLTGCGSAASAADSPDKADDGMFKVGLICLHDENSPYDLNFIESLDAAKEKLDMTDDQIIIKTNISESEDCTEAIKELAEEGCDIIFADSFGHEPYMVNAADDYPDIQFCHATGTLAHVKNKLNYHNGFAQIYEGRYVAGVAAGMKLNQMIDEGKITPEEAVMGYVGAFTYAEVISGYTAFYLGAKSVCPSVTMQVYFTGSWYDEEGEKKAAEKLISNGCVLISQHADSMGAPSVCEKAGVPNISYNGSTVDQCPNTFIVSSRINWEPFFEYVVNTYHKHSAIDTDWAGDLAIGAVQMTDVNDKAAAPGTEEALAKVIDDLNNGKVHVFDTSTFTVDGETLTSYMADVDTDSQYTPDTEVIKDGYFHESEFRCAPYFDLHIDGITTINEMY